MKLIPFKKSFVVGIQKKVIHKQIDCPKCQMMVSEAWGRGMSSQRDRVVDIFSEIIKVENELFIRERN